MALGVPNGGAFGTPAPQSPMSGGAANRPPRAPTQANAGMNRMPAAWNRGMGAIRPDRGGAMNGQRALAPGGYPMQRSTAQRPMMPLQGSPQFAPQQRPQMNPQAQMPMQSLPPLAMNANTMNQQQRMGPLPPPGAMPSMPLSLESLGLTRPPPRYGRR